MKAVICGRGGQGVVTLNTLMGSLASKLGHKALSAETHGMAIRGGSVYTFLKIGGYASASVASRAADIIISADGREVAGNLIFLKKGGIIVTEGDCGMMEGFQVIRTQARKTAAEKFGGPVHGNTILMGIAAAKFREIFPI